MDQPFEEVSDRSYAKICFMIAEEGFNLIVNVEGGQSKEWVTLADQFITKFHLLKCRDHPIETHHLLEEYLRKFNAGAN